MLRKFDDDRTLVGRVQQIWLILIGKAANRQTMTYGQLADELGFEGAGTLARMLEPILRYCDSNGLPGLTSLVVNQETGIPGDGIGMDPTELHRQRERVFQYKWYWLIPPSPDEFQAVLDLR